MRHLEVADFYLQGLVKSREVSVRKVKGTENVPDLGTKYLAWTVMQRFLRKLDVKLLTFAGAAVLPVGEAVVTDLVISAETLAEFGENLDAAIDMLKWKLTIFVGLLVLMEMCYSFAEKVFVEVVADKAKVFLGHFGCGCGRRRQGAANPNTEREELVARPRQPMTRPVAQQHHFPLQPWVYAVKEQGSLKVHLFPGCHSLASRSLQSQGLAKGICYHCAAKRKEATQAEAQRVVLDLESQVEVVLGA